jgi:hypothetical protein
MGNSPLQPQEPPRRNKTPTCMTVKHFEVSLFVSFGFSRAYEGTMKTNSRLPKLLGCLLLASGLATGLPALASPMAYTGTVVTDVRVGEHLYHNAAVTLTFTGDTKDIAAALDGQGNAIMSTYCSPGTGWFFWLTKGSASVSVQSRGRTLSAHFAPGQIFVALDACNGGIGFGSYTGPHGMEVAYPLAFTLGTAMALALNSGLSSPAYSSGDAWSCIGYPPNGAGNLQGTGSCTAPDAYPLHSDAGDVFIYQPYTGIYNSDGTVVSNHNGSLNRGTFAITAVISEE